MKVFEVVTEELSGIRTITSYVISLVIGCLRIYFQQTYKAWLLINQRKAHTLWVSLCAISLSSQALILNTEVFKV